MPRLIAAFVVVCAIVSSARADHLRTRRYQYGGQTPYYYGGSDPDVFRFAAREYGEAHNGFTSATADTMSFREVTSCGRVSMSIIFAAGMRRSTATRPLTRATMPIGTPPDTSTSTTSSQGRGG